MARRIPRLSSVRDGTRDEAVAVERLRPGGVSAGRSDDRRDARGVPRRRRSGAATHPDSSTWCAANSPPSTGWPASGTGWPDTIDSTHGRSADAALAAMLRRSAELAGEAGLDPAHGPGLTVTLNDAQRDANGRFPRDASPDDLVVHQQDIQAVLNALWSAGAEAIQMQDQRIIGTSVARCVGNTLLLNGRTYSPPYTITAIGDASAMQSALAGAPLVILYKQYVVRFGLGYAEHAVGRRPRGGPQRAAADALRAARRPGQLLSSDRPVSTRTGSLTRCRSWSSTTTTASSSTWCNTSASWVSRRPCGATTTRGCPTPQQPPPRSTGSC